MTVQSYHFVDPKPNEVCGICYESLKNSVVDHGNGDLHPVHQKCVIAWEKNTCAICRASVDKSPIYTWKDRWVIRLRAIGVFMIDIGPSILGAVAAVVIGTTLGVWANLALAGLMVINGWSVAGTQLALSSVTTYHRIVVEGIRDSVEVVSAPIRERESLIARVGKVALSIFKISGYILVQLYTLSMYGISPVIRLVYRLFPRMGETGRLRVAQGLLGFSICLGAAPLLSFPVGALSGAAISFQVRHIQSGAM